MKKKILGVLIAIVAVMSLAACEDPGGSGKTGNAQATKDERNQASQQLDQFQQSQPVPNYNWSQLRQNLIEIQNSQANTTATTSFMFLQSGAGATGPLVYWCPSIGFPIPASYQLTNPERIEVFRKGSDGITSSEIDQLEPTGVYSGDTTGTYVMCVGTDGKPFAFYHEGFVSTVTGPAHWDEAAGEVIMDGASTAEFSSGK